MTKEVSRGETARANANELVLGKQAGKQGGLAGEAGRQAAGAPDDCCQRHSVLVLVRDGTTAGRTLFHGAPRRLQAEPKGRYGARGRCGVGWCLW